MAGLKVYVYAICKNEERFAERWYESMKEADGVYVLDTGSNDGTVDLLRRLGAQVESQTISPWRFDVARNRSLEAVPEDADICVCTDLDEVFQAGWREKMERAWSGNVRMLRYRYTWSFNPDGSEGYVFWIEKAHARKGFRWVNPVHEVLKCDSAYETGQAQGVQLDHFPDGQKSRAQYLPLLEQAVAEDPENDRNMHYLGREYMYRGDWGKCIQTLERHLKLPTANWADERAASMRYLARANQALLRTQQAEKWHLMSVAEAPHLRETWLDYAAWLLENSRHEGVVFAVKRALEITERPQSYISESESWGAKPYDLISVALYYTGRYEEALVFADKALALSPDDKRIIANRDFILQRLTPDKR